MLHPLALSVIGFDVLNCSSKLPSSVCQISRSGLFGVHLPLIHATGLSVIAQPGGPRRERGMLFCLPNKTSQERRADFVMSTNSKCIRSHRAAFTLNFSSKNIPMKKTALALLAVVALGSTAAFGQTAATTTAASTTTTTTETVPRRHHHRLFHRHEDEPREQHRLFHRHHDETAVSTGQTTTTTTTAAPR